MDKHPVVKKWMKGRPENTIKNYVLKLKAFCEKMNITPEEFQQLDKKKARDLVWDYISEFKDEQPSVASIVMSALKNFYRNHDREKLEFDSGRGGKHYTNFHRRKRAATEHIPTNEEVYLISEHCTTLRDKTIVHIAFQSGIRVNALCRLTYGMMRKQLESGEIPLRLRITSDIDTKLRHTKIEFYDTFLNVEAIALLQKYCDAVHEESEDNTWLFLSRTKKRLLPNNVWMNIKKAVKRAKLNDTITVHALRKAFKRQVRNSRINHDHGEMLMGHVLPGSQENYAVRNEMIEELKKAYVEVDLSREGKRSQEFASLSEKVETLKGERETLSRIILEQSKEIQKLKEKVERTEGVEGYIDHLYKQMKKLQEQINELTGTKRKLDVPTFVQPEQE